MLNKLKHIFLIAWTNGVTWIRSPRVIYVLLIEVVMCYGGFFELGNSLEQFGWKITPIECFLFLASRERLITGTLFLIFISEIPPRSGFHTFQWIRTTRSRWAFGCILYCAFMVVVMLFSLTLSSIVCFSCHVQWGMQWSDNIRIGGGVPESMAIIPASIRTRYTPLEAYFAYLLLTGNYWLFMAMTVMLAGFFRHTQLGLSFVMVLQLLPWITNTFSTLEEPTWFPVYYSDITLLQYSTPGLETFWRCTGVFLVINVILASIIRLSLKKAPLLMDAAYKA